MTTYEILLLLDPEQAEARQDDVIARARELVEAGDGSWRSHDAWGRRRLAYPITHKEEGVYHLIVFDAEAPTLDEISRVLKIDDAVLRHMATRHIAGSRTSAPRDDAAAVPVAAADAAPTEAALAEAAVAEAAVAEAKPSEAETTVSTGAEPEYAGAEEEPAAEEPAAEQQPAEEEPALEEPGEGEE
ncbi:MAG TPA: 30S ribosomal protein S6 [Gaiellaceae bacterium]